MLKTASHTLAGLFALAALIGPSKAYAQFNSAFGQQWGPNTRFLVARPPGYQTNTWGQVQSPNWGTYDHRLNAGGWNLNYQYRPSNEGDTLTNPQSGSVFANPRTGASLYQPPDTRLRGRDRP